MSSIFEGRKVYKAKYEVRAIESLAESDLVKLQPTAKVTESDYGNGLSVCFTLVTGEAIYVPVDMENETYRIGDTLVCKDLKIKYLIKPGETKEIARVM
jgi:hypothetical protein